jgi:hypothetical protein
LTTHCLTHLIFFRSNTPLELFWLPTELRYTPLYSPSILLTVPSYNSSARIPQETPSSVVKNACLLLRYLAVDVLLLRADASVMRLPIRCLAMGMCVTLLSSHVCLGRPSALKYQIIMWERSKLRHTVFPNFSIGTVTFLGYKVFRGGKGYEVRVAVSRVSTELVALHLITEIDPISGMWRV